MGRAARGLALTITRITYPGRAPRAPDHVGVMETRADESRGTMGRWACSCGAAPERWGSVRRVGHGHFMHVWHAQRRTAAEERRGLLNLEFAQLVGPGSPLSALEIFP